MARGRNSDYGRPMETRTISDEIRSAGLEPTPGLKGHETADPVPKRVTKKFLKTHGKRCFQCALVKPLIMFSKDSTKKYGVGSRCRACDVERVAKRSKNRSEVTQEIRELAMSNNADEGYCCYLCDQELDGNQPVNLDHVVPLSLGGADAIWNLAPVHKICNQLKWRHHWSGQEYENAFEAGDIDKCELLEELYDRMHRKIEELDLLYNLTARVQELGQRLNAMHSETDEIFELSEDHDFSGTSDHGGFDPMDGAVWDDPEVDDDEF